MMFYDKIQNIEKRVSKKKAMKKSDKGTIMNSVEEEKSTVQSPDSISEEKLKKLVEDVCKQAIAECFKVFEEKYAHESGKVSLWKKIHYSFAYILIILSIIGGLMSWNKEIITTQIAEIQAQKNEKVKLQKEFNKAVFDTRVIILNQNILCKIRHHSAEELQVERLNTLKNLIVLNSTIRNTYGPQASTLVSTIVSKVYDIVDVCNLNAEENDQELQILFQDLNKVVYNSIIEDNKDLNKLIKKRHQFELPVKI